MRIKSKINNIIITILGQIITIDDNGIIPSLLKTSEPVGINAANPLSIPLVIQ